MAVLTLLMLSSLLLGVNSVSVRELFDNDNFKDKVSVRELSDRKESKNKGCGSNPADIAFILDESGSIWEYHFNMEKDFVKNVIKSFHIGPDNTRIAAMTFADDTKIYLGFSRNSSEDKTIEAAIDKIKQRRGNTRTDLALDVALKSMFRGKMRPGVDHVAIVITDGKSDNTKLTREAAKRLKDEGITIIALGVGTAFRKKDGTEGEGMPELKAIASDAKYVFSAHSFQGLDSLKEQLAWAACKVSTTSTTTTTTTTTTTLPQHIEGCESRKQLDLMFGLAPGASNYETNLALDFFRKVVEDLEISEAQVQAGLIPRSCNRIKGIRLKENDNKKGFLDDLDNKYFWGSPNHLNLNCLLESCFSPENARQREDAVRTAILIMDNPSSQKQKLEEYADYLRDQGVKLIVIGIQPHVNEKEVKQIAAGKDFYFLVDGYENLDDVLSNMPKTLCRAIMESRSGRTQWP